MQRRHALGSCQQRGCAEQRAGLLTQRLLGRCAQHGSTGPPLPCPTSTHPPPGTWRPPPPPAASTPGRPPRAGSTARTWRCQTAQAESDGQASARAAAHNAGHVVAQPRRQRRNTRRQQAAASSTRRRRRNTRRQQAAAGGSKQHAAAAAQHKAAAGGGRRRERRRTLMSRLCLTEVWLSGSAGSCSACGSEVESRVCSASALPEGRAGQSPCSAAACTGARARHAPLQGSGRRHMHRHRQPPQPPPTHRGLHGLDLLGRLLRAHVLHGGLDLAVRLRKARLRRLRRGSGGSRAVSERARRARRLRRNATPLPLSHRRSRARPAGARHVGRRSEASEAHLRRLRGHAPHGRLLRLLVGRLLRRLALLGVLQVVARPGGTGGGQRAGR